MGLLEVGKYADLAVLNQDPLVVEPAQLESTEVLMTMVGGRIEFCHEALRGGVRPVGDATAVGAAGASPAGCPPDADNVALHAAASASSSLSDRPAAHAVDGDVETGWGAGAHAEQWIEIDLGQEREINCVRLLVDQFPAGHTIHRVNGGADPDPGRRWACSTPRPSTATGSSCPGRGPSDTCESPPSQSPSWVSWLEIEAH